MRVPLSFLNDFVGKRDSIFIVVYRPHTPTLQTWMKIKDFVKIKKDKHNDVCSIKEIRRMRLFYIFLSFSISQIKTLVRIWMKDFKFLIAYQKSTVYWWKIYCSIFNPTLCTVSAWIDKLWFYNWVNSISFSRNFASHSYAILSLLLINSISLSSFPGPKSSANEAFVWRISLIRFRCGN